MLEAIPAAAEGMRCDRTDLESQLLRQCLRNNSADGIAFSLLDAQAAKGTLDVEACRRALRVSSRSGAWREALSLLRHLEQCDTRTARDFGDAIGACGAGRQLERMWKLAAEAEEEAGPLGMQTHTAMMHACRHSKDSAGCEHLWQRICASDESPDERALWPYLMLCADLHQWQRAEALLAEAEAAGLEVGLKHWNVALTACVRAGAMADAERMLDAMPHSPSVTSFNTLLHGYAQLWVRPGGEADRLEAAESLRARMQEAAVPPNEVTYNALLDLFRFDVRRVQLLLEEMSAGGIRPCRITYTKLARALWNAQQPHLARELVPQMEAAGIFPDATFYGTQIALARRLGMATEADALQREAQERGLEMPTARGSGGGEPPPER